MSTIREIGVLILLVVTGILMLVVVGLGIYNIATGFGSDQSLGSALGLSAAGVLAVLLALKAKALLAIAQITMTAAERIAGRRQNGKASGK